jgi:hypothetical protein
MGGYDNLRDYSVVGKWHIRSGAKVRHNPFLCMTGRQLIANLEIVTRPETHT